MIPVNDTVLFSLIHDFFKVYLPEHRNASEHTIKSYRAAVELLLDFVKSRKGIALYEVTFEMIDSTMIAEFLDNIEKNGCSISTRNHRRNGIRAFYKYAAKMKPTTVIHRAEIYKVPAKNLVKPTIVGYMSEAAVKAILEQPDTTTYKGLRDQFLMVLLYDTGARIQEIMDIKIRDIHLGQTPTVTVTGKRKKKRVVPIMDKTVAHYLEYKKVYYPNTDEYSEQFLFSSSRIGKNGKKKQLHHDTARKFIYGYGLKARAFCREVPDNVHPHLWRHSRAMHLYQHGMDLTLISQWLGHSKLETTLIYAHADTEKKRFAIQQAQSDDSPMNEHLNTERYTINDDERLKRLYGLR